ncbi:hypothetical protein [Dyella silvatica]|uniref:hypothetical protein n=1 Tax=Dyella silvatica TaxID=2992128 RepID=UPI00225455E7|nr:hypothetical protein [Dyella silvatica]
MILVNLLTYLLDKVSPYSVDTVLARHERDITRLQKVADNRRAAAEAQVTAAQDLLAEARDHADEAAKADRIASRMKSLLD